MISPTELLHPSPAPHFKTFQVFLIYGPKRPSFSYVTMVDKIKAIVGGLQATSATMLSEKKKRKRKMVSKKWYLKRNMPCDAHMLNELLETDVS
jgi:hypothetical protein